MQHLLKLLNEFSAPNSHITKAPTNTRNNSNWKKKSFSFKLFNWVVFYFFCNSSNVNIWRSETLYLIIKLRASGGGSGTIEESNIEITTEWRTERRIVAHNRCRRRSNQNWQKHFLPNGIKNVWHTDAPNAASHLLSFSLKRLVFFFVFFYLCCRCRYRCYTTSYSWSCRRVACSVHSVGMLFACARQRASPDANETNIRVHYYIFLRMWTT